MNTSLKLIGFFILFLFNITAQAQNYYVCDTGDDANLGKSEIKPFKTHAKAMEVFNKMSAGDSILYCRGGKFQADTFTRISNSKCGTDKVCTIADYGLEDLPKPIIYSAGNTVFNFQNGGDSRPDGGYILKNIDLVGLKNSGTAIMLYNEVNDIVVDNLHIEGFAIGFYAAGANKASSGNRANNRVVLKNSTILNNRKQGWLGGCNDCLIENNHFENNGTKAIFDHNIYIDSPIKEQSFYNKGITISGNTLTKSTYVDGKCSGVSLVAHGILKDLIIENNYIKEYVGKVTEHCWGIGIDPGNALDESFIGLKISNNKLINVGNTGIGCASCVNVLINNNTIIDEGNVLRSGIAVPNKKSEDSIKSDNVVIENNKIILNHELGYGVNLGGSNVFTVRNNDISTNELKSRSRCFMLTDGNSSNDTSNNLCDNHTKVSISDLIDVINPTPENDNEASPSLPPSEADDVNEAEESTDVIDNDASQSPIDVVDDSQSQESVPPNDTNGEIIDAPQAVVSSQETIIKSGVSKAATANPNKYSSVGDEGQQLSPPRPNSNNRAPGGGSSSGRAGSAKSSSGSTAESQNGEQFNDDNIAYFEIFQPSSTDASGSLEIDATIPADLKTIQNSSPSITKMKDVIQASQEDLSNINPTQCRASANGKCLMK